MNDIRRSILWVAFGFSIVLLWDRWQIHNGNSPTFFPTAPAPNTAQTPVGTGNSNSAADAAPRASSRPGGGTEAASAVPAAADGQAASREKHRIRTDVLDLLIDSEGASIVRADLLAFKNHDQPGGQALRLLDQATNRVYVAQSGMISATDPAATPTHKTPMRLISSQTELTAGQQQLEVVFASDEIGGVQLIKRFLLRRGEYLIQTKFEIHNNSSTTIHPQIYVQLVRDASKPPGESFFYSTFTGPAFYTEAKKYQKVDFSDIDKGKASFEKHSDTGYVAMVEHYFTSAWFWPDPMPRENFVRKIGDNLYAAGMIATLPTIEPGAKGETQAQYYVGPQLEKKLESIYPGLELVKDYGWLTILAKPLYWLLDWLHQLLNNWGWAIVALVVVLKGAFYWFNAYAYRSMGKMKAINPRVMDLRDRLKDNPQQMQAAMMKLYREEKVNPMGGCLPIIVQMPVFIALYWVLLASVEMRDAPWIGWVQDLAAPDPYFVLPFLMTLTSLLQTWLNPTPPDPVQAKLMWFMPLAFSVMFFFFPSGLVLYWLTNNILSIAQQWTINKQMGVSG